jgi:hypothetical protein
MPLSFVREMRSAILPLVHMKAQKLNVSMYFN